jgi:hypothetical protein
MRVTLLLIVYIIALASIVYTLDPFFQYESKPLHVMDGDNALATYTYVNGSNALTIVTAVYGKGGSGHSAKQVAQLSFYSTQGARLNQPYFVTTVELDSKYARGILNLDFTVFDGYLWLIVLTDRGDGDVGKKQSIFVQTKAPAIKSL